LGERQKVVTLERLRNRFTLYRSGFHKACARNIVCDRWRKVKAGKTGHLPKTARRSARIAEQSMRVPKKSFISVTLLLRDFTYALAKYFINGVEFLQFTVMHANHEPT
jgi:hypothetical protein